MNDNREILKSYYKDYSLVSSQIKSFNYFIEHGLQDIILGFNKDNLPENLLEVYNEIDFNVTAVRLGEPEQIEVDGSTIQLTPNIARLRKLTYSAPLFLEISTKIGAQKEKFEVLIAKMPILLKSNKCVLTDKNKDELIELNEDPEDPGGYFVINGTERVVVYIEDLALNKFFIESKDGKHTGRMFSERGVFKSLQEIGKKKDGSLVYTFGNFKQLPIFLILKSLGMVKDKDILDAIGLDNSDLVFQLSEYSNVTDIDEAIEQFAKKIVSIGTNADKKKRINYYLDNFVLPHIGSTEEARAIKAKMICKLIKKYMLAIKGDVANDDKDHLMNKRLKLVGNLFSHLFMSNFSELIVDILTNFQRTIKRGRFSSLKIIVREKFLTQNIQSAMAKGNWSDGRRGVSQYLKRESYFDFISHLTRVVSPLSSSQENFDARELHATQYGRLCALETPEGHTIGLRKSLSVMSNVTYKLPNRDEILDDLEELGLKR